MKLTELLRPWVTQALSECDILGLQNDSRNVKPGYLFIAYPGEAADGRLFIEQAIRAGASAIVYESEHLPLTVSLPTTIPCVPVVDLVKKLSAIASRFYGYPTRALSVTGVTGTNGKTTIAYQLAQAYGLLGEKAAYIGTLGQGDVQALQPLLNTTPDALCLQALLDEYQHAGVRQLCMEVSSHALSQGRVENIDFSCAIYTNLSHDHLDYHHTMQAYAAAKAGLFAMPTLKSAVINRDDAFSEQMIERLLPTCRKLTYGLQPGCDVQAVKWQTSMIGSTMDIVSPWGRHHVRVNLLGKFNIYNSLAVFTSLLAQGIPVEQVVDVMSQLVASPGRMEVVSQEPCVIVDYAHTPDALENVLTTLQTLKQGRLGVVFGCGGDRDKTKRPIMGRIASQYADFSIVTSDNPRTEDPVQIVNDVAAGLLPEAQTIKIIDREEAIQYALNMAGPRDIVLIAGKGHESYQQIGTQRFNFSDQNVVRKLLGVI
jgi:UDP-N-acetylmuramoyl-L-alanyl-D-glutamate--2,6-diaminopimelate ligase